MVGLSVGGAAWAGHGAYTRLVGYPDRPGRGAAEETIALEIPPGASFPRVLALLVDKGVIPGEEAVYFKLFVLHRGEAGRVTAGEHLFTGEMSPTQILEELTRRQPVSEVRVTIPEGKHMLEIAEILAASGLGEADEYARSMRDEDLLRRLEIPGSTIEGYLFPDTYRFAVADAPDQVLGRLVTRHREVYEDLRRRHRDSVRQLGERLGWGDREVVILASIVEKETAAKHERPRIAGVFLNRMRFASFQPKYLATDPTIIYGCTVPPEKSAACREFKDRIRRIHLQDGENPYNTYTHEGLPPGPISNPGRAALEAVLAPEKSSYLYFVHRNDGTHQFSRNRADHEAAVDLYQRHGAVGDGTDAGPAGGASSAGD